MVLLCKLHLPEISSILERELASLVAGLEKRISLKEAEGTTPVRAELEGAEAEIGNLRVVIRTRDGDISAHMNEIAAKDHLIEDMTRKHADSDRTIHQFSRANKGLK
jgi:hypothetical protein